MKNSLIFFFGQFFNYCAVAVYTRLVSQAATGPAVMLDVIFASVNFFLIRRIAESKGWAGYVGYVLGSGLGTLVGIVSTVRMGH